MELISAQEARDNWAALLDAARDRGAVFGVTYWAAKRPESGDPDAVLLSPDTWREGRGRAPVPESDCQELGVRDSRIQLRLLRESAAKGTHTLITRWGVEQAVLAPFAWVRKALPELVDVPPAP